MAVEAAITQYRKAFIDSFETRVAALRQMTTKETMVSGLTATFLVSGSGGDVAVTRGVNGQIPYGNPTNNQISATLVEKHAPYELTGFNIFASQGDQKALMRKNSMAVINRDIDRTIIAELANATIDTGGTATASLAMVQKALAYLGAQDVPVEEMDNMFGLASPAMRAYMMQSTEFTSRDYVNGSPLTGPSQRMWRWAGINWTTSSQVTGVGTNNEYGYIWHRDALGYAVNVGEDSISIGYDDKQDLSWSRASIFHAAKILQNTGIVRLVHDGSAFALT